MAKEIRIALAGNPNSGKTTLFNALTGSNQFVGNWPGVTVEKKEGRLKNHKEVTVTDLPGIYSLSPYTLEEVVARNYLIDERPDVILNIVDATNLERNLYLTTQLMEIGIPVVIALNMMDLVRKKGDKINVGELSRQLGCKVVEISALKSDGIEAAADADAVYTDVWASMGQEAEAAKRRAAFAGVYQINDKVMASAKSDAIVLHCLPAHREEEITAKVFEAHAKEIFDEAENRLHAQKAVMATLMAD